MNPDISIVIINYNTNQLVIDCIDSIYRETSDLKLEIIVIDNCSREDDPQKIIETHKEIQLVRNQKNLGFGSANNQGIELSKGKFILLLNSDTLIINNAINKSFDFMESAFAQQNNIGLMGCTLKYENGTIQKSSYKSGSLLKYFISNNRLIAPIWSRLKSTEQSENNSRFVSGVSGAFMFFRANVFNNVKAFDPDFFLYSEETELCRNRVSKKYNIYHNTDIDIIHKAGASSSQTHGLHQALVSHAFRIYKEGIVKYFIFCLFFLINVLTDIIFWPLDLIRKDEFNLNLRTVRLKSISYILLVIPRYRRAWGSNRRQLKIKYFENAN